MEKTIASRSTTISPYDFAVESFTVWFWMRWTPSTEPHSQHFITKGDCHSAAPDQAGKRWEIFVSGVDTMCFTIDDDVVASRIQVPLAPFITGKWVHLTADRDVTEKRLKLYADGKLLKATHPEKASIAGIDRTGDISNSKHLTIGDSSLSDNPFAGDIDDVRVYLGALSDKEIGKLAKAKKKIPRLLNPSEHQSNSFGSEGRKSVLSEAPPASPLERFITKSSGNLIA